MFIDQEVQQFSVVNFAISILINGLHQFAKLLLTESKAKAAHAALDAGTSDEAFYRTKLATGRFYMKRRLPATALHLARIESGAEPVMELDAEAF